MSTQSNSSQDDQFTPEEEQNGEFFEGGHPDPKKMTLNEYSQKHNSKFFFAFFLVGIFNNNGYTLVQAAADDLAKQFN